MASPDNDKPAPKSPPVQDSPIFGYVSSLSPIKPVNARPIVQVYENIDVPSPQLVFKTPNFIRPRNSSLSERSQHLTLASTGNLSPGYVNNMREFPENTDISSTSLSRAHLISYSDKECVSGDPSPNQSCTSPSNCVASFLTDPSENGDNSSSSPEFCVKRTAKDIEGDNTSSCENKMETLKEDLPRVHLHTSAISVNEQIDDSLESSTSMVVHCLYSNQDEYPSQMSQNDSFSTKESTTELRVVNMKKYTSGTAAMSSTVSYQTKGDPGSALAAESMKVNKESITEQLRAVSKNVSIYSNAHNKSDSRNQHENSSTYQHVMDHPLASKAKDCDIPHNRKEISTTSDFLCHSEQDLKLQNAETGPSNELDCIPQFHPCSQKIQTGDNHIDNSVRTSSASIGNHIIYDLEDCSQHQRGKRKRLQFEAAENPRISNRNTFNYTTEASTVDLPVAPSEAETVHASHAESTTLSNHKQVIQSVPTNASCRFSVKVDRSGRCKESALTATRPAGIGLHLNSIGSAASMNCNSNVQVIERNSSVQEEKELAEDSDQVPEKSKNFPASLSLIESGKLNFSSEKALHYTGNENNEEWQQGNQAFQQLSSVSYQSPLNVKSLNSSVPLKHIDRYMTPCIMKVLPSEEANKSEESSQTSPRKKRKKAPENDGHKRCNCKRSKCLKLYCDCFAAGSFCSEACACQECSNRLEYKETVCETRQQIESRNPLAFAPKVILRVNDLPKASGDNKSITPTSARHKRGCNCKKSLCLKKYCECFQAGVGCSLGCRCEGCKNTFGTKDGCEISEVVVEHKRPKEEGWERDLSGELEGIEVKRQIANTKQCHSRLSPLTPLLQGSVGSDVPKPQFPSSYFPSPESVASVVRSYESSGAELDAMQSGGPDEDRSGCSSLVPYDPGNKYHNSVKLDSFSAGWEGFPDICNLSPLLKNSPSAGVSSSASKTGERKVFQTTLFEENRRISLGPISWRSSPITPLPQFGESKFLREPDSESGKHCNPEDDTPEILKETRSPIKSVKATSPNQKRVSPPHQVMCSTSANSPSSLRSGRKVILQSMPAFPPLTPYSKSNKEDGT